MSIVDLKLKEGIRKDLIPIKILKKTAKNLLNALGSPDVELSIYITEDDEMAHLNEKYRQKPQTTDVLSFALQELSPNAVAIGAIGDVIISLPRVVYQARELGCSIQEELIRLLIHGVLHLHGYEHEGVPDDVAHEMEKKEKELFKSCFSTGP